MKFVTGLIRFLLLIFIDLIYSLPMDKNLVQTGLETERVINGKDAESGQFPYVVRIRYSDTKGTVCTGALITKKTVLTAAHCITDEKTGKTLSPTDLDGILGSIHVTDTRNCVKFHAFQPHKEYNPSTSENDIAIFILKEPANLIIAKTIALADEGSNIAGKDVIAVGWGLYTFKQKSDRLRYMEIFVADPKICEDDYDDFDRNKQICSGQRDDMCTTVGDSGGPLVTMGVSQDISIGVLSFGPGDMKTCKEDRAVYISVGAYKNWINSNSVGDVSFVKLTK